MRPDAFIRLLLLARQAHVSFTHSFFLSFFLHDTPLSLSLCLCHPHPSPPSPRPAPSLPLSLFCLSAEGSKCKSSWTVFLFRRALISADDVSKEVKGTRQGPQQLLSPIHRLQIYVSPSPSPSPPHPRRTPTSPPTPLAFLSCRVFNIINIDRATHLDPLFFFFLTLGSGGVDKGISGECGADGGGGRPQS